MQPFATDIDLLHWEPNVMIDAAGAAQTMLAGTGDLAGTIFTISAGTLASAHVTSDHAIVLAGDVAGSFPIIHINTATELELSVLYDDLYRDDAPADPCSPGAGNDLNFFIRTFWPQRQVASELLLQAARILPENSGQILNPDALRRPCTLGSLQLIYTAMAASADEPAPFLVRADLYQKLYERALRSARLELDLNGDGIADEIRSLNIVQVRRI
jgi:hypothetical protein